MDPVGMLIWGAGFIVLGILLALATRRVGIAPILSVIAGAACLGVAVFADSDEITRQWAAIPSGAVCVVFASALLGWAHDIHRQ